MMELSQRRARLVQRLRTRKTRTRERLVLVEGVRAAREALDAGAVVTFAVVAPRLDMSEAGRALRARLEERSGDGGAAGSSTRVPVVTTTDAELERLSDTEHPQGVLLVCAEPEAALAGLAAGGGVLVLDAVQDPGNVGTLVRSAVAFGLGAVLCLDGTVDPWSPKVVRASAGTAFRTLIVSVRADDAIAWMQDRGCTILVASAEGVAVEEALREAAPVLAVEGEVVAVEAEVEGVAVEAEGVATESGFALILGNEGGGVREELREVAHATIAVQMHGGAESLNVGTAGSILMHELMRELTRRRS